METFEITIPLRYLPNVEGRVAAVNRKMSKRGAPPFVLEEVWRGIKRIAPRDDRDAVELPAVTIRVSGEPFKVPGYSLAGVFYRGEDGEPNRLVGFGGHVFTPEQQACNEQCDHCNTKRERKVLFFMKNEAIGVVQQIGGDCAEVFLGISPAKAVNTIGLFEEAMSILRMMEEESWDDEDAGMGGPNHLSVVTSDYLAYVAAAIRQHGWYSKTRAEEARVESTASEAAEAYMNSEGCLQEDREMAQQALDHWKSRFPIEEPQALEEFDTNLKLIVHSSRISTKSMGRAAWLVQGYQHALLNVARAAQAALSTHQGDVGDAIETVLRVDRVSSFETQYGVSFIYSMSDANGNAFAWKTASPPNDLQAGVITSIRAKIKDHSEYRGVKQTNLSHVKPEVRFAEFPASPQEWLEARTQAFLIALAGGWFNKSLAKGVDIPAAIDSSIPPVLGMLVDRWLSHSGMYREGTAVAIKETLKAGGSLLRIGDYHFAGERSFDAVIKDHPELAEVLQKQKLKGPKRPSSALSM